MHLVLDATVMSNFALVGRIELLRDVWPGDMVTTQAAWDEIQAGIDRGLLPGDDWSWLDILSLTESEQSYCEELMPPLDIGEATCMALARSRGYALFSDDRAARREARRRGIPLSGTLGVLRTLVEKGRISLNEADAILHDMMALGYYSPVQSLRELK
jgi:predicted nucleic acid-binding protein